MDDEHLTAVALAWRRRQRRPAWLDMVDCPDPRTGVRASARVWRGVLRELGVSRFEDMPADRATLQAVVDRVEAARPPASRSRGPTA